MKSWLCSFGSGLVVAALLVGSLSAQTFTMTAGTASGLPGDSVGVSVTLDSTDAIRGFSLGITHPSDLTMTSIDQGSAVLATNGGMGADFIFMENNPVSGGPGGVLGIVVSLSAPIEDIPAGSGIEIAVLDYDISGSAAAGASLPLVFSNNLVPSAGSPPVSTVVSVAGTTFVPALVSGSVDVETPPVENLVCTLVDACVCTFGISWTNPTAYDSIEVTLDGVSVASLGGAATSANVTLPQGMMGEVCVVATSNGESSALVCCMIDCPTLPPVLVPSGLACTTPSLAACDSTLTWTNNGTYASIAITEDGATIQTLAGTATTATVTLPTTNTMYEYCVVATDDCGVVLAAVCCTVECVDVPMGDGPFVRGDCNDDGGYDIADAVTVLGFLFPGMGGPTALNCDDACDCNDDDQLNIADAVCALSGLFGDMTVPPAAPHPACGFDPVSAPNALGCATFNSCP